MWRAPCGIGSGRDLTFTLLSARAAFVHLHHSSVAAYLSYCPVSNSALGNGGDVLRYIVGMRQNEIFSLHSYKGIIFE